MNLLWKLTCSEKGVEIFISDREVILAAAGYRKSYLIGCVIVGINFSMMGYLNGCGRTMYVALQGMISTFLVRIPVSYFMSKIAGVTLFQIGFATPLATVFAIVITTCYLIYIERKNNIQFCTHLLKSNLPNPTKK